MSLRWRLRSVLGVCFRLPRSIGIDTPETVDPRKTVQCFGKEASNKAKEMLLNKKVRLESDHTQGDKDKYGRLLRYAYIQRVEGSYYEIPAKVHIPEFSFGTIQKDIT